MPADLEAALRSGPFEHALHLAIEASGLSLDSLRRRLGTLGITVGLSTLSYWQRGVRRPERAESLRAVFAIEDILGLPRAGLVALLGPPRPRGRWSGGQPRNRPGSVDVLGEAGRPLESLLDGLDLAANDRMRQVSVQAERWMGGDRSWRTERIRRVVAAVDDGADRFVVVNLPDTPDEKPPTIRALHGCRLGRVRADGKSGLHAAELIFPFPLTGGRPHVFDYEYLAAGGTIGVSRYQYASRQPLRELVLRAHFDPAAIPARCYHIRQSHAERGLDRIEEIHPGAHGAIQVVSLDTRAGIEGFTWEWD